MKAILIVLFSFLISFNLYGESDNKQIVTDYSKVERSPAVIQEDCVECGKLNSLVEGHKPLEDQEANNFKSKMRPIIEKVSKK